MNMDESEQLLSFFRDCMPQFQISKENLLRPTPDLVFRFYTNFISEFYEGVTFLVGSPVNILNAESDSMDPEERLLQKMTQMCEVFEKAGMRLLHGDIYEPTPVRTKNLFKICMHFLSYTDKILDDTERLGNYIRNMRDDTLRMRKEQHQLIVTINEAAKEKSLLLESVDKLTSELKIETKLQEEYEEHKTNKEKIKCDKRKQIEIMKRELQKEEYELEMLEKQEKDLTEQTITKDEHISLLQMLDNLESEIKYLGNDDVNMADILLHENDILEHYQACKKRVPDISEFNIEVVKNLIRNEEILNDLEVNTDKLHTKLVTLKQSKNQKEKNLKEAEYSTSKSQIEYETNKMFCLKKLEELRVQLTHLKKDMDVKVQISTKNIASYKHNIDKLKNDLEKTRKQFCEEYIKYCKAEKATIDKFNEHLHSLHKEKVEDL